MTKKSKKNRSSSSADLLRRESYDNGSYVRDASGSQPLVAILLTYPRKLLLSYVWTAWYFNIMNMWRLVYANVYRETILVRATGVTTNNDKSEVGAHNTH